MKKKRYATFFIFATVLIASLAAYPACAIYTTKFSLALSTNQIQFKIPKGTTFSGTVSATGLIRFWATAPGGGPVTDLGLVEKTTAFSFVSLLNGTYTFNFENDMPNTVTVTFSYDTYPSLPNTGTGTPATYILAGVLAVAVAGSLFIIFLVRIKNRKAYKRTSSKASPE